MRKSEKEIKEKSVIEAIIKKAEVMRLGMTDGKQPYVIPINFGYKEDTFYFHSAKEGRKLDLIRTNPLVCIEIDEDTEVVPDQKGKACNWSAKYKCVIAEGKASVVEDFDEKVEALNLIMAQYSNESFTYGANAVNGVEVVKISVTNISGKQARE